MQAKARVPEETDICCPTREETADEQPMRDLKEAVAKITTQAWCEPLEGRVGRARSLGLPKPDILSVTQSSRGGGWAMKELSILPGERPPVAGPL